MSKGQYSTGRKEEQGIMAENSKIEWTDHTFNPWSGCQRVSPGCQHCYAETMAKRNPQTLGVWGPTGTRVRTSAANWRKPLLWNKQAQAGGRRFRVFCASMADVFERRDELIPWRAELMVLIQSTPNLDWLLLTKRPENILDMVPWTWHMNRPNMITNDLVSGGGAWPSNVWIGTSVENQEQAQKRIPELLKVPAAVRFLSCEPLLGPVNLELIPDALYDAGMPFEWNKLNGDERGIKWVIAGAESGHGARPMSIDWVRGLRNQCQGAGVPFFFKQMLVNGKKVGLPELDGQQWVQMPEVTA